MSFCHGTFFFVNKCIRIETVLVCVVYLISQVFESKECGRPGRTKRSTDDFFLEGNSRQRRDDEALARTSSQVNLDR